MREPHRVDPPMSASHEGLESLEDGFSNFQRLDEDLVNIGEEGDYVYIPKLQFMEETEVRTLPFTEPVLQLLEGAVVGVHGRRSWTQKDAKILAFGIPLGERPEGGEQP